ncbi:MAG TPA: glycosyltransferase family A protein, partial [Phycisphaerae bacterium]|nr:glycosyltransferase family A protein [Phycisphaerae bacterium]
MLLSVFTPTNNPRYLIECLRSLDVQKHKEWEWIIAPNGKSIGELPQSVRDHPNVRICPYEGPSRVGALKKFCCSQAKGEVLVELDHDDVLVPGILQKVAAAVDKGAGFVYSDSAVFIVKDEQTILPVGYSEMWGWETYPFRVYDREFLASRTFDITARSLCEVYYAPDHVRCWKRSVYEKVGGHDDKLEVGDDHDLICRTYLSHTKFTHTNSCGYLYRNHPGNTVKSHN